MKSIEDLMIHETASIFEAYEKLQSNSKQVLFVVNGINQVIGTLTDGDLRQSIMKKKSLTDKVTSIYNSNFTFAFEGVSNDGLIKLMRSNKIKQIPILNQEKNLRNVFFLEDLIDSRINSTPIILMAGGYGSRLGSLTKETPKPLLKFGTMTFLEWQLNKLAIYGFYNVYISVRFLSEKFQKFLKSNQFNNLDIQLINEDYEMGTAGSLSKIKNNFLKENKKILVVNADVISNLDYLSVLDFHEKTEADLTISTKKINHTIPYGVLKLSNEQVVDIVEKPNYINFVNMGIYVLNVRTLTLIPESTHFGMDELIKKALKKNYLVNSYLYEGDWVDVGHPEDYLAIQNKFDLFN